MRHDARLIVRRSLVLTGALVLTVPALAEAQSGRGFLFEEPSVSIALRTGYDLRRADSDIFSHTRELFTVDRRDFDGASFGGEVAFRATDRVDVVIGLAHSRGDVFSEYREYVDQDDLPIEQGTEFETTPLTLSARFYLADRGRSIGRFAWVPARLSPYIGGGVGMVWYSYEQSGDFIDFETPTLDIFTTRILTKGETFSAHALAGLDISLNQYLVLNTEARLVWARGEVKDPGGYVDYFSGFEKMDLAGLQITMGLAVRF